MALAAGRPAAAAPPDRDACDRGCGRRPRRGRAGGVPGRAIGPLRAPDRAGGQHRRRPGRRRLGGDGDGAPDPPGRGVNRLAGETSPYLLQHADNPVDWYPWGEEALERARREDRPVLLSVGYAAGHWGHVMGAEAVGGPAAAEAMDRL